MRTFKWMAVCGALLVSPLTYASPIVSNLANDTFTRNNYAFTTAGGRLALGFTTASQSVRLDSITMRLRGGNYVAPVPASIPVDIYTSGSGGSYETPDILLGSLSELSVSVLAEYVATALGPLVLSPYTTYWAVLSTGSFEDLYAYQGGPVTGPGNIVSPSLRYNYNDTQWNQVGITTFAMEVVGTPVSLPGTLPLALCAAGLLFGIRAKARGEVIAR